MKKKITIFSSIVLIAVALRGYVGYRRLQNETIARFPELDSKLVRKAYNVLMKKSVTGKVDVEFLDDDEMDKMFLDIYYSL